MAKKAASTKKVSKKTTKKDKAYHVDIEVNAQKFGFDVESVMEAIMLFPVPKFIKTSIIVTAIKGDKTAIERLPAMAGRRMINNSVGKKVLAIRLQKRLG